MDELEEISFRMKVSKLEAQLALVDIEISAIVRELSSRRPIESERVIEVRDRLDILRSEQAILLTELDQMHRAQPSIRH